MIVLLQAAADAHWQRKIEDERTKVHFMVIKKNLDFEFLKFVRLEPHLQAAAAAAAAAADAQRKIDDERRKVCFLVERELMGGEPREN
jgi:hypothetical protein